MFTLKIESLGIEVKADMKNVVQNSSNIGILFSELNDIFPETESLPDEAYFFRNQKQQSYMVIYKSGIEIRVDNLQDPQKVNENIEKCFTSIKANYQAENEACLSVSFDYYCEPEPPIDTVNIYEKIKDRAFPSLDAQINLGYIGFEFELDGNFFRTGIFPTCEDDRGRFRSTISCRVNNYKFDSFSIYVSKLEQVVSTRLKDIFTQIFNNLECERNVSTSSKRMA